MASLHQIVADQIAKTKKKLNEILSANTGQPLEIVEKDTDRDNYICHGIQEKISLR